MWNWIKSRPLFAAIAAGVLIILCIWFRDVIGGQVEKFNRWRFDKAIAVERAEIERLKAENQKLLEEARKAFALGEAKELERDAAYAELEKYGAQARAAVEAQKKAGEEYAKELTAIDADMSLLDRCRALCRERAEVGYGCKPSTEDYCRVYSGR